MYKDESAECWDDLSSSFHLRYIIPGGCMVFLRDLACIAELWLWLSRAVYSDVCREDVHLSHLVLSHHMLWHAEYIAIFMGTTRLLPHIAWRKARQWICHGPYVRRSIMYRFSRCSVSLITKTMQCLLRAEYQYTVMVLVPSPSP